MKRTALLFALMAVFLASCTSSKSGVNSNDRPQGGPQIGGPGMGGSHRPSPSPELQALIDETVPSFKQYVFVNEKGDSLQYNLFTPKNIEPDKQYPLVLFMADASTPGPDPLTPLIQGYGGLVWATP